MNDLSTQTRIRQEYSRIKCGFIALLHWNGLVLIASEILLRAYGGRIACRLAATEENHGHRDQDATAIRGSRTFFSVDAKSPRRSVNLMKESSLSDCGRTTSNPEVKSRLAITGRCTH